MNEGLLEYHQSNLQGYPEAAKTDKFHALKPKQVQGLSDPPQRLMIVCASNHSVDQMLDMLTPMADKHSIVRLGQSFARADLNEKYALEATKKADGAEVYQRVQARMEQAKILVTGTFSLR